MSETRRGDWMQTHSGRAFWPLDPRPEEIDIEDIAHALAQQNRYAGHAPWPYSVAQHSVLVSRRAEALAWSVVRAAYMLGDRAAPDIYSDADRAFVRTEARSGLLHDAAEAYLVDVPRPVKGYLGSYREIEARLMAAAAARFEVPSEPSLGVVKRADEELLATEAAQFFPVRPREWHLSFPPLPGVTIVPCTWEQAKAAFLARWEEVQP